jgi:hypothetical protein
MQRNTFVRTVVVLLVIGMVLTLGAGILSAVSL